MICKVDRVIHMYLWKYFLLEYSTLANMYFTFCIFCYVILHYISEENVVYVECLFPACRLLRCVPMWFGHAATGTFALTASVMPLSLPSIIDHIWRKHSCRRWRWKRTKPWSLPTTPCWFPEPAIGIYNPAILFSNALNITRVSAATDWSL